MTVVGHILLIFFFLFSHTSVTVVADVTAFRIQFQQRVFSLSDCCLFRCRSTMSSFSSDRLWRLYFRFVYAYCDHIRLHITNHITFVYSFFKQNEQIEILQRIEWLAGKFPISSHPARTSLSRHPIALSCTRTSLRTTSYLHMVGFHRQSIPKQQQQQQAIQKLAPKSSNFHLITPTTPFPCINYASKLLPTYTIEPLNLLL